MTNAIEITSMVFSILVFIVLAVGIILVFVYGTEIRRAFIADPEETVELIQR